MSLVSENESDYDDFANDFRFRFLDLWLMVWAISEFSPKKNHLRCQLRSVWRLLLLWPRLMVVSVVDDSVVLLPLLVVSLS